VAVDSVILDAMPITAGLVEGAVVIGDQLNHKRSHVLGPLSCDRENPRPGLSS